MCFNYVDYLNFSQPTYQVFEDEGFLCINLTFDKPALFNTTVQVDEIESSTIGKQTLKCDTQSIMELCMLCNIPFLQCTICYCTAI